ncbi:hypothetical protein GEMRC1_007328 [Eukaryota sp. GEM-RC1]
MQDSHVLWLRTKICLGLGLHPTAFDYFIRDENNHNLLSDFLYSTDSPSSDSTSNKFSILVFTLETTAPEVPSESPQESPPPSQEDDSSSTHSEVQSESKSEASESIFSNLPLSKDHTLRVFCDCQPLTQTDDPHIFYLVKNMSLSQAETFLQESQGLSDEDPLSADTVLSTAFEYGLVLGHPLSSLERTAREVFLPLTELSSIQGLTSMAYSSAPITPRTPDSDIRDSGGLTTRERSEFAGTLKRFSKTTMHSAVQLSGDSKIVLPDVNLPLNKDELSPFLEDADLVDSIASSVQEWTRVLADVLVESVSLVASSGGPTAEVDLWRDRAALLSAVYQQLSSPKVQSMRWVVEHSGLPCYAMFNHQFTLLSSAFLEAKDNVKFLSTLERHFKTITFGNFQAIIDSLPSLLNALRMVWVISRHYNTDDRMKGLLERIAWQLCQRVRENLKLGHRLSKSNLTPLIERLCQAKTLLDKWKSSYFDIRAKIEESGRDSRWEFDQRPLFGTTSYIADRCSDLIFIVKTVLYYRTVLGPKLKSVTGAVTDIDEVRREVDDLVLPISTASFDVFSPNHHGVWSNIMLNFHSNIKSIHTRVKSLFDDVFSSLRSTEGALMLLREFTDLHSSSMFSDLINGVPKIDDVAAKSANAKANVDTKSIFDLQLQRKLDTILMQYSSLVDSIKKDFDVRKDNPPIPKGFPKLAGTVIFSRTLFQRIKKPFLRFQEVMDLNSFDTGQLIKQRYFTVARGDERFREQNLF